MCAAHLRIPNLDSNYHRDRTTISMVITESIDVYRPDRLAQNCGVQTQSPKM